MMTNCLREYSNADALTRSRVHVIPTRNDSDLHNGGWVSVTDPIRQIWGILPKKHPIWPKLGLFLLKMVYWMVPKMMVLYMFVIMLVRLPPTLSVMESRPWSPRPRPRPRPDHPRPRPRPRPGLPRSRPPLPRPPSLPPTLSVMLWNQYLQRMGSYQQSSIIACVIVI